MKYINTCKICVLLQEEMSLHFSACLLPLQLLLSIAELFLTGFFIDNFPEDDGSKSKV